MTELTHAELKSMTMMACISYDLHRKEAMGRNECPPAWLCMSEESQRDILEKGAAFLTGVMRPIVPFTVEIAEKVTARDLTHMKPLLEKWQRFELEMKTAREAGEPTAFFAPHSNPTPAEEQPTS